MNRNINKAIEDYHRLARKNDKKRSYQLYFSDIVKILDKNPTSKAAAVVDALSAGFTIGYKAAKKKAAAADPKPEKVRYNEEDKLFLELYQTATPEARETVKNMLKPHTKEG